MSPATSKSSSASLGVFARESVRRYLEAINGHPAAQLHRLIMAEVEKPLLQETVKHCEGNLTHAAEMLGISRATLRKKLDDYGIAH
jgi:Fis family transcriptional regulator, factor for inversion stimulation protein